VLVGGDFNAEPDSRVLDRLRAAGLRDAWAECGQGAGLTYPAAAPVKRIDYVFLTGVLACTSARVIDTTISDHRPLLVTVVRRGG
jgi:endonuclease/exonuclease/phosphatase (EEP) superfamily protein YafD